MNKREIPRHIQWHSKLSDNLLTKITELCFLPNTQQLPETIDIVFIFGTSVSFDEIRKIIKKLVKSSSIKNIIITGGLVKYPDADSLAKAESHLILENIEDLIPASTQVYIEDKLTNTIDNILFSLAYINTVKNDSLLYISKSYHTRRALLTLKKLLPDTNFYTCSNDCTILVCNKSTRLQFKQIGINTIFSFN